MTKEEKALKIKIMLKEKGITQRALAQKIGESHNQISNRLNGDRPISAEFLMKLRPILGDEVMDLLDSSPPGVTAVGNAETRPRLPLNVTAGGKEILDAALLSQCEQVPVVPMFPNYTFTMKVTGESMQPYICPGDEVACLKIETPAFLQWGRIHVLFTSQGAIVKRIYDGGEGIRCVSLNEAYQDFTIPKSEIYSYNLVIGLIRICN
jgi:transcriptional regulator with XRE-family HTH domain